MIEPRPTPVERDARDAAARGIAFLEAVQLPHGEFRAWASNDPEMVRDAVPDPSIFPTALIAQCLAWAPAAFGVRDRALDFLERERDRNGLWRHWTSDHPQCRQLPPDLDDTACASAALAAAGRAPPPNRELLLANRDRAGLFFTWVAPRPRWSGLAHLKVTLAQLAHAPTLFLFFRNTSAAPGDVDAVVNANTLHYLGAGPHAAPVVEHLLGVLSDGREAECDKWYDDPFAVRYFLSRALRTLAPAAGPLIEAGSADRAPRTALQSALAACARLDWGLPADDSIGAVLRAQLDHGAWPRAALYHGGRARLAGGAFAARHPDTPHWGSEELTTAFCVEALSRWSARA
jgi:hypothetical protein